MLAISIVALVISAFALPFTAWAAHAAVKQAKAAHDQSEIQREQVAAAREQTQLQRELAREAAQPYVWADIQPDMQQGTMLQVVVGNSGPTMAHNVRVTFTPPLPAGQHQSDKVEKIQRTLASGIRSLAPNRVIRWSLGAGYDLQANEESVFLVLVFLPVPGRLRLGALIVVAVPFFFLLAGLAIVFLSLPMIDWSSLTNWSAPSCQAARRPRWNSTRPPAP